MLGMDILLSVLLKSPKSTDGLKEKHNEEDEEISLSTT